MKYFYTNPLAAAWMAKHFGMEFYLDFQDKGRVLINEMKDLFDFCRSSRPRKFFLPPDSLHLLEPQDGDIGQEENGEFYRWSDHYKSWQSVATVHDCEWEPSGPVRIIQRNGIAFHWPEQAEREIG